MSIVTSVGVNGGEIQSVLPDGLSIDGTAKVLSSTPGVTTNPIGSSMVYLFGTSSFHIVIGKNVTASDVTINHPPFPAGTPITLPCGRDEKIAYMEMAGGSGGTLWICKVKET